MTARVSRRKLGRSLARRARALADDALYLGGAASIVYGVSLVHEPSAWGVGGLFALGLAYLIGRAQ